MLFSTCVTGMAVARPRISDSMLVCAGERCWIRTNARPVFCGSAPSSSLKASSPPAEAPIAAMGNGRLVDGVA
jgi:hypothetical protein